MMGIFRVQWLMLLPLALVASQSVSAAIKFGPYEALTISEEIIRGVKVDDDGKIWLLLNPDYLDKQITLKISSRNGADYRKWHTGEYELISPTGQDKRPNQWTDWIRTQSRFIEYWMDGNLILHLQKVE